MKKLLRWLRRDYWVPRWCIWPYPTGWGTYNPYRRTLLDTGLTRPEAEQLCKELNRENS